MTMTIDYFAELGGRNRRPPDMVEIGEVTTRYHVLIATGHKKDKDIGADALRAAWGKGRLRVTVPEPAVAFWQAIAAPTPDLSILPTCSFSLCFTFTLAQPYISKDDNAFNIVDNPIVRDKVFQLPLVRPSSWKGNLAATLRQLGPREGDAPWQRLFGKVNEAEDEGQAGRLVFFPTFFTQTGLEIINPHDRRTKVGRNPILFESVPSGAKGTFTLLYVPFDRVGKEQQGTAAQVAQDLALLAEGLRAMFTVYGFSAKRTSGFGLARETVGDGTLALRIAGLQAAAPPPPETPSAPAQDLPRYLEAPGRLRPEYLTPDGRFRERSEAELKTMKKADRQLYDKAKAWWEREGRALAEQGPQPEPAITALPPPPAPTWPSWEFASFDELVALADQAAQQLTRGGAQ
jgi:CRISPR-associated protein Cmr2